MRKLLLTTSALVAATSLASYAVADVSVSANYEWTYTTASTDDTDTDGDSYNQVTEVTINFSNKTDSGLTVGATWDISAGVTSDEESMFISGGFGRVDLGANDHAADAYAIDESDVISEDATYTPGSSTISTSSSIGLNGDTNKIKYTMPAMGNLTGAVSYQDSGVAGTTDETSIGAQYSMDNLTVGWSRIEAETASGTKDSESTNMGIKAVFGATTVIASAGDHITATEDRENVGFGVKQALDGGMHIAASMVESEDEYDKTAAGLTEKLTASHIEMGYSIAPGLSAFVSYSNYDYENGGNSTSIDDDGTLTKLTIKATF